MSLPSEQTPLIRAHDPLGDAIRTDSEAGDYEEDVDESIDMLLSKFGSPGGSLGLSGGMGTFGTSFGRRGSMSFTTSTLSRIPSRSATMRRRPSEVLYHPGADLSRQSSRADLPPLLQKTLSRKSTVSDRGGSSDEEVQTGEVSEKPPKFLYGVSEPRFWACFGGIVLTWFVATFDSTLMASSHPVITSYFDASNAASWLSTSFLLTSTAFQPMFGRISDTFGRKDPFLFSVFAFLVGTIWCASAQSIVQFILARAVCGLGAGGAMSLGSIINSDLVPLERRGIYISLLNLSYGTGSSLGAALGGFLADALGWRWEFGIQVPAIALCFAIAIFTTPSGLGPNLAKNSKDSLWKTIKGFDLAGSFLLTSSVTMLVLALNLGGNILPWSDPLIIAFFVSFCFLSICLLFVEQRALKPILPLHILSKVPASNIILSNFLMCMTMNTILFNVPLYFQATLLDSPTRSGTRLIIPFVLSMVAAFITGNFITWTKRLYPTLLIGYVMIVLGSVLLTFMSRSLPSYAYSWLIAMSTIGQGFSFPTLNISTLAVTSVDDMAVATSTLILFRSLGTVMGVAVSSLVSQNALLHYLEIMVQGKEKEAVIREVRKSVEAIATLSPFYREQVIDAYAAALKVTFAQGIVTAAIALVLILFIRLPMLTSQPVIVAEE